MIRFTLNNVYKLLCIQLKSLIACALYLLHIYAVHLFYCNNACRYLYSCINACNYLNYNNNIVYYFYYILTYDLTAHLIVLSSNSIS